MGALAPAVRSLGVPALQSMVDKAPSLTRWAQSDPPAVAGRKNRCRPREDRPGDQGAFAGLYLEQGRTADVKRLVLLMEPVFRAKGVPAEARKALLLFRRAVEMETATVELAGRVAVSCEGCRTTQSCASRREPERRLLPLVPANVRSGAAARDRRTAFHHRAPATGPPDRLPVRPARELSRESLQFATSRLQTGSRRLQLSTFSMILAVYQLDYRPENDISRLCGVNSRSFIDSSRRQFSDSQVNISV